MSNFSSFQSRDSTFSRASEFQPREGGAQAQFINMPYAEQQDSWFRMQKKTTADSLPKVDMVFDQDLCNKKALPEPGKLDRPDDDRSDRNKHRRQPRQS